MHMNCTVPYSMSIDFVFNKDALVDMPPASDERLKSSHKMINCLVITHIYMSGSHKRRFCFL